MAETVHSSSSLSELPSDSSTKTSSSVKVKSHRSSIIEPAKDEGFSPIDMECQIQEDRITKSLEKLVYLTKLTLCLPVLIKKKILSQILTLEHLDDVYYVYEEHQKPLSSYSTLNMSAVEDLQSGDLSLKHRFNPEMSCILNTLNTYAALKPHVEQLTEQGKKPPAGLAYLLKLERFRDLMVVRMKATAAEEISAILQTRRLEKSNSENIAKISEYAKRIKEEKEDMERDMQSRQKMIAQLEQEYAFSNHRSSMQLKKQILNSERQMVLAKRAHTVKYQMLKEEEVECQDVYERSLDQNLTVEKQLRDRRRKVETQLKTWLQKYDLEMSVKQANLDEILEQYEVESKKAKEKELELAEQDVEYNMLMAEREKEYDEEMTTKMNQFIIDHAARVIQVSWRQVLINRSEKVKLLKLRRKQEQDRAVEARKAAIEAKKQALEEKKHAKQAKREAKAASKAAKKAGQVPAGETKKEGQAEREKEED